MKLSPKKGFTLIEIVIVLAIAALIMVIVFLAVAGAQRSQRDTTLKNNAARVLAGAEQYASNTSGVYPANVAAFQNNYLSGISPAPLDYTAALSSSNSGNVYYSAPTPAVNPTVGHTCNNGLIANTTNPKQVAVVYWSEVAGSQQCVNN